jgi:hypothetical protein
MVQCPHLNSRGYGRCILEKGHEPFNNGAGVYYAHHYHEHPVNPSMGTLDVNETINVSGKDPKFLNSPNAVQTSIKLEDRDYTVAEVAFIFGVHEETVKLWLRGKTKSTFLVGKKVSNRWVISATEIVACANRLYGRTSEQR